MHFTLKQISYFVAAAETGSITLASERVNISQPSISSAIAVLEANFGLQLFIRHHAQGLSLTGDGQRFLREARLLLQQADELQNAGSEISKRVAGPLEIGCLATLYPLVIPELLYRFKQRHANARVNALAGHQTELFENLRTGHISMALTYAMGIPADLEFTPLAALAPYAYVSANHRLAKNQTIKLADLAAEPFILLDLPMSRDYFLSLFTQTGVTPNIGGKFPHFDVIRSLVARGEGYSIANARPKNQASLDGRDLAYLKLDSTLSSLTYGILTLKGARRTPTLNAFTELCRELLAGKQLPGTV
ncbi:MAG: LysR family transcriptional regulator [Acidocella sp. 20-57-95]|nr:MAG: LysR family transcriptional regulator [Acidocella sp. 20-57-95]OYV58417.1 MAG: LysR family transcriptional regulator [Acidocella sp. 21-58-7]HQT62897.1 LysR family transcriptional regulator [Acidocella sp.]